MVLKAWQAGWLYFWWMQVVKRRWGGGGGLLHPIEEHSDWSRKHNQIGLQLCLLPLRAQKQLLEEQHPSLSNVSCAVVLRRQLEWLQTPPS